MAGYYTEITDMTVVPESAAPGELVNLDVYIKNIYAGTIYVMAQGWVNSDLLDFNGEWGTVPYGSSLRFGDSFIMPSSNVILTLASYFWDGESWILDDIKEYTIRATVPDEYPTSDIADFDLLIPAHTNDLGGTVLFTGPYKHKGVAIAGTLTISLGTGLIGTFFTVHTFNAIPVSFLASHDWEAGSLSGSIVLPTTLTPGQTYSVRGTLRTNDGAQEIDTDWGVITISEIAPELEILGVNITPVGRGHILTDPASEEGKAEWHDGDIGGFPSGANVEVTAVPINGYVFEKWSDEIVGGVSYSNPAYVQPMTEHRGVKAHFVVEGTPVGLALSDMAVTDWYKKGTTPTGPSPGLALGPGDTLVVDFSFSYRTDSPADVVLWASIGIGIGRDMESFKTIHLETSLVDVTYIGSTEIPIPTTGKANGSYWMKVEVDGQEVTIMDAVVISDMPSGGLLGGIGVIGDLITLMIVMMMMQMMMGMMEESGGFTFAVGETAGRGVKWTEEQAIKKAEQAKELAAREAAWLKEKGKLL